MFKMLGKAFGSKKNEQKTETVANHKDLFYKGIPVPVRVIETPSNLKKYHGRTRAYYCGGYVFIEDPENPGNWHRTQQTIGHSQSPLNFYATEFSTMTSKYSLVF